MNEFSSYKKVSDEDFEKAISKAEPSWGCLVLSIILWVITVAVISSAFYI